MTQMNLKIQLKMHAFQGRPLCHEWNLIVVLFVDAVAAVDAASPPILIAPCAFESRHM